MASTALVVAPPASAVSAAAVDDDDVDLPVDLSQLPRIPPAKTLLLVTNFVANTTRFLNHFAGDCESRLARVSAGLTRVEILLAILEAKLDSIPDLAVSDAQVDAAARAISGDAPLAPSDGGGAVLGIDSQDLPDAGAAGFVPPPPPPPPSASLLGDDDGEEAETRLVVGGGLPPPPPPPPGLPSFDDENGELSSALVLAPAGELDAGGLFGDDSGAQGPPVLKLKDDPVFAKYFTMRRLGIPDPVIEQKLMLDGMDPSVLSMDPEGPSPSANVGAASSSGLPPPPPPGPPQPPSGNIGLPFPPPPPPVSPTSSTSSRAESLFSAPTHPPPPPPDLFPATGPPLPPMPDHDESSSDDEEEFEADRLPAQPGILKLKDDPAFAKYFTMRKLGMPDGVIQHKLMMDGVTLDILSMDPEEGVATIAHSITKVFDKTNLDEAEEKRQAKVAELVDMEVMVLNAAQLAHIQQRSANPFTISVNSPFRHWWDFTIAISTAFVMFEVPIKVGFSVKTSGVSFVIDVIVDVIFLVDILLNFFTSYEDDSSGEEIQDIVKIRENYLYSWFIIDAISSFPASLIGTNYELANLAKVIKLSQMSKISNYGLFKSISTRVNRSMNPSMMRMMTLTLIFIVSQHFIACTYFYISNTQAERTSWGPSEEILASSLGERYIYAFYFAIMVTTANDVSPTTSIEKLFTALMLFVGIVINASIIGSAANLLSNLDKTAIARKNQMDSINEYMRFKKVPLLLQDKIRRYYDYALTSRIRDPTDDLFVDLPDRMKLSLKLSLHEEFIRKTPLFRVCSNAGIIAIIQCLTVVVAMPGEIIVRQGEVANEFYFIKSGRVSISVQSVTLEAIPLGNLGEGSFFGETSLLTGEPQGADIHAESLAELAYLTQRDFSAIAEKFPTFHLAVKRISESRMQTAQNVRKMSKYARQQSTPEAFNSLYVERLSLTKARELSRIRAISDVEIDNPDEELSWEE